LLLLFNVMQVLLGMTSNSRIKTRSTVQSEGHYKLAKRNSSSIRKIHMKIRKKKKKSETAATRESETKICKMKSGSNVTNSREQTLNPLSRNASPLLIELNSITLFFM
jgi:hypothetical protein